MTDYSRRQGSPPPLGQRRCSGRAGHRYRGRTCPETQPRQIQTYIQKADALCTKLFDAKAEHLLNRHLLQRRRLYLRAIADGDYRLALSILQDEAKLENLYPSGDGRPGVNVNNQVNTAISAAEIADLVTRAEAQRNGTLIQNRINDLANGS